MADKAINIRCAPEERKKTTCRKSEEGGKKMTWCPHIDLKKIGSSRKIYEQLQQYCRIHIFVQPIKVSIT